MRDAAARMLPGVLVAIAVSACGGESAGFMVVPDGWEVRFDEEHTEDVYPGTEGEEVRFFLYLEPDGWPVDRIFIGAAEEFEERYGVAPVLAEQLSLDDTRLQVYQHHEFDGAGLVVTQRAVVLDGDDVWFVDWIAEADEPGAPRERLIELVRAFVPGPLLPDEVRA